MKNVPSITYSRIGRTNLSNVHVIVPRISLFKKIMENLHFSHFSDCNSEDKQLIQP